jgi:hypothetical protein
MGVNALVYLNPTDVADLDFWQDGYFSGESQKAVTKKYPMK